MDIKSYKQLVEFYLPDLQLLIGDDDFFGWERINSQFIKICSNRNQFLNEESKESYTSLYDLIKLADLNFRKPKQLLFLYNSIFEDLNKSLSIIEKKLIWPTIKNLLKSTDFRFTNFIGELAVLNYFYNSGNYTLEKVEYKLKNGKSLDFTLKSRDFKKILHLEVQNIHLKSDKISGEFKDAEVFLSDKFKSKIEDKSNGISFIDFYLVPVLHGNVDAIKSYSHHYFIKNNNFNYINEPICFPSHLYMNNNSKVHEPLCFMSFLEMTGDIKFVFDKIGSILYSNEIKN